jgi:4-hydroxy-3-polyprenylbenzoate decarboxylase
MPVVVALGGPPALYVAAAAPLPPGVDETAFAGLLCGEPLAMTPSVTCDLAVPAAADFVLEGVVLPGETRLEGPFGNHTGAYAPAAPAPVFRLTALSRRTDAIYPATVAGPPPMEDCWLAKLIERLFLPLLRVDVPEVVDLNLPVATIFHGCALVSARVAAGEGRELLRRLWRTGLLGRAKLLVLFSDEVDVQQETGAWWQAVNRFDPGSDLVFADGSASTPAVGGQRCR